MRPYFLDTSALIKQYRCELGSETMHELFESDDMDLIISRLGTLELEAAIMQHVRGGTITLEEAGQAKQSVLKDIARGRLNVAPIHTTHFRLAGRLVQRHGSTHRLRTLDALQLATAVDLRRHTDLNVFVCADKSLNAVARLEGFSAITPEPNQPAAA